MDTVKKLKKFIWNKVKHFKRSIKIKLDIFRFLRQNQPHLGKIKKTKQRDKTTDKKKSSL
jgi:hypothetical protein